MTDLAPAADAPAADDAWLDDVLPDPAPHDAGAAEGGDGEGGDAGQPDDDDFEDFEDGDKRYRIPKALKPRLMLQSDYTEKTTALARDRDELEAQRTSVTKMAEGHFALIQDVAKVVQLNEQLAEFEKYTPEQWAAAHERDPDQANNAWRQYQLLKESRDRAARDLQQKDAQRLQDQQATTAKALEQRDAVLAREVKGWTKDKTEKLANAPEVKKLGYSPKEVLGATDPRAIMTLRLAVLGEKARVKESAAARAAASGAAAPVPRAQGSAPKPGLRDDLSGDEWLRRRNAELSAKAKPGRR